MTGLDLARELALLGAESCADAPQLDAHHGWSHKLGRWEELGRRMSAHLDIPDAHQESLCVTLGLSPTSYWLVMLCGAVEVFPDVAHAMAVIAGDAQLALVTPVSFARLLRSALGITFTRALSDALADASAERMGLVERQQPMAERPITHQPIRLTLGALKALLGSGLLEAVQTPSLSVHREEPATGAGMAAFCVDAAFGMLADRGMLCIRAASPRAGRQLALDLASRGGVQAYMVAATDALPVAAELGRLRAALPVLDLFTWCRTHPFPEPYVREVGQLLQELVVVVSQNATTYDLPTVEVEHLTWADSTRVWHLALDGEAAGEQLARTYRVTMEEARRAIRAARDMQRVRVGPAQDTDAAAIALEVLAQGARRMDRLVTPLSTAVQLDSLAVPKAVMQQLREIISWYQTSATVDAAWSVPTPTAAGTGLYCVFVGPSGTGKTLAARCIASALHLNIYRVGLQTMQPGREDDMARLFDEAEAGHGILLFDDMDVFLRQDPPTVALAALLQRLYDFPGVAIVVAGSRAMLGADLLRKVPFLVEFPFPDRASRRVIWEQSLPAAPRRDADLELESLVERFALSGGSIHNACKAATHVAATTPHGKITTAHLVQAVYRELEKIAVPDASGDFGPLARYLP